MTTPTLDDRLEKIIMILTDKKAQDVVSLNVTSSSSITDYFVIATGMVDRHVKSLADDVETAMREQFGDKPLRVDGLSEGEWVIMDYGDVIVHLFVEAARRQFRLEELWGRKNP